MAFVAGVILMYLPEEPAFRVLCQLLDGAGVGLRSMYLPDLSGLKEELRMLDWLMERTFTVNSMEYSPSDTCTPHKKQKRKKKKKQEQKKTKRRRQT